MDGGIQWKLAAGVVDKVRDVAVEGRVDGVRVVGPRVEVEVKQVRATLLV